MNTGTEKTGRSEMKRIGQMGWDGLKGRVQ